jgi:hypothetical protein
MIIGNLSGYQGIVNNLYPEITIAGCKYNYH